MIAGLLIKAAAWLSGSRWGLLVLAVFIALGGVLLLRWRWIDEGIERQQARERKRALENQRERQDVEEAVEKADPDERRERLGRWASGRAADSGLPGTGEPD